MNSRSCALKLLPFFFFDVFLGANRAGRAPATPAYVLSVAGDAAQDRVLDALERDLGVKLHGVELGGGAVRLVEDA